MGKFIMLGMDEEHGKLLYELVKKEIDTIDIIREKKCYEGIVADMNDFLESRRKTAAEAMNFLGRVFYT